MNIYLLIAIMALTTYLIRAIPLTLLKKPIKSQFINSFLHYVPVACLTAMTFPAILYATDNIISGVLGLLVGILIACFNNNLVLVAISSCLTVFLSEQVIGLLIG
ncbi:MAG: AzlD domain-containing protein [Clostridia bacterium]|nr:AzlD domain-containing protein [Clostridia bacterium]